MIQCTLPSGMCWPIGMTIQLISIVRFGCYCILKKHVKHFKQFIDGRRNRDNKQEEPQQAPTQQPQQPQQPQQLHQPQQPHSTAFNRNNTRISRRSDIRNRDRRKGPLSIHLNLEQLMCVMCIVESFSNSKEDPVLRSPAFAVV